MLGRLKIFHVSFYLFLFFLYSKLKVDKCSLKLPVSGFEHRYPNVIANCAKTKRRNQLFLDGLKLLKPFKCLQHNAYSVKVVWTRIKRSVHHNYLPWVRSQTSQKAFQKMNVGNKKGLNAHWQQFVQRTLTVGGSITVRLVSSFTRLH